MQPNFLLWCESERGIRNLEKKEEDIQVVKKKEKEES